MRLKTKLTEKLGIEHPILLAPMHVMAGGKLAAAVSGAGGLGLIGGGYGDADWLDLRAIIRADGDSTVKSRSVDVARKRYWPNPEFLVRVLNNGFVAKWHGREQEMEKVIDVELERFWSAFKAGDADNSGVLMGEVSGIVRDSPPAARIVENMVAQACQMLGSHSPFVVR